MNNFTMHMATRRVSGKAKGSRSLKGVDRLVRLLPFAQLLLGYLWMTFVLDDSITIKFR